MSEPDTGLAAVRPPWSLRSLLVPGARSRSVEQAVARKVTLRAVIASRVIVWVGALGALALFGQPAAAQLDTNHLTRPFSAGWANFVFAPAARWDSTWYLQIAHSGYFSRGASAFFPLYPLLVHLGAALSASPLLVGLLISIASFAAGLYLLYLLARLDLGDDAARTTVYLLAFFPTALFFSAVYTESLFLVLSVGAFYAARRERWIVASVLGGLAAASRSNGVLIVLPLAFLYFYGPCRVPPGWVGALRSRLQSGFSLSVSRVGSSVARGSSSRSGLCLLLVPAGLIGFLAYLGITQGTPSAPFQAQYFWGREFAGPFGAVWHLIVALPLDIQRIVTGHAASVDRFDPISWATHDLIDLGFLLFSAAGLAWAWRRVPIAYSLYALVMLAETLSYPAPNEPLESFPRYMLVIFPLFMGWGAKLADKPLARRATLVAFSGLLLGFSGLWGYWSWIA